MIGFLILGPLGRENLATLALRISRVAAATGFATEMAQKFGLVTENGLQRRRKTQ